MRVREIMSRNLEVCTPEMSLPMIARKMKDRDIGAIPVVDSGQTLRPVGIITDRDIIVRTVAEGRDPMGLKAADCMTSEPITVTGDLDLSECVRMMEQNQIRRIVVVDEGGRCCGIVSQADIAECASVGETAELVKDVSMPGPAQEYNDRPYH